jgi:hypothetical protein
MQSDAPGVLEALLPIGSRDLADPERAFIDL